jgi:vacuolar-type H+-ATPase subunit E/Vma4
MSLGDLLRALDQDLETRIAALRTEAEAAAARVLAETGQRLDRRRNTELAIRESQLRSEAARRIETTRREATRRLLDAQAGALNRIRVRARELLLRTEPEPPLRSAVATAVRSALEYFGDKGVVVRCAPAWESALRPILDRRVGSRLEPAEGLGPGATITATDGSLEIDATLERRFDRLWPRLAIDLVRELEGTS